MRSFRLFLLTVCVILGGCQPRNQPQPSPPTARGPSAGPPPPGSLVVQPPPEFTGHLYYRKGPDQGGKPAIWCWHGGEEREFYRFRGPSGSIQGVAAGFLVIEHHDDVLAVDTRNGHARIVGSTAHSDQEAVDIELVAGDTVEWVQRGGHHSYRVFSNLATGETKKLPWHESRKKSLAPDGSWDASRYTEDDYDTAWSGDSLFMTNTRPTGTVWIHKATAAAEEQFASFLVLNPSSGSPEPMQNCQVDMIAASPDQKWAAVEVWTPKPFAYLIYLVPEGATQQVKVFKGQNPCLTN